MLLDAVDIHLRQGASQIVKPVWDGLAKSGRHGDRRARGTRTRASGRSGVNRSSSPRPKVLCWVAMDRGADMARLRHDTERAERWRKAADELKAEILEKGVDGRGRFRQHYGNDELDASLLLIPILGFLPPDDERVRATVLAIADELTEDGLVLRYKVDTTDTGFEGKEGTFTICSFWLVTALAMIGEQERATALCQKLLDLCRPAAALRGRDRHLHRESTSATSRRPSPTWRSSTRWAGSSRPRERTSHRCDRGAGRRKEGYGERREAASGRDRRWRLRRAPRHPAPRAVERHGDHADRPAQSPPLPAAALPGRHRASSRRGRSRRSFAT